MKTRCLILVIASILLINIGGVLANAPEQIDYYVVKDSVLVEMNFDVVNELELRIPKDASTIEVNKGDYLLKEFEEYQEIGISSGENIKIKYITKSLIDKSGKDYFFIVRNPFRENISVTLNLPETAVLTEKKIVSPPTNNILSDGRSISLNWPEFKEEQILVSYTYINQSHALFYSVIIILLAIIGTIYVKQNKKHKKEIEKVKEKVKKIKVKKEEKLTWNLFEDEKKIVQYLMGKKDNECWTKEIAKDLGITKVKLSRKLRSLEQKEVIKKLPYGNENRIRLLK